MSLGIRTDPTYPAPPAISSLIISSVEKSWVQVVPNNENYPTQARPAIALACVHFGLFQKRRHRLEANRCRSSGHSIGSQTLPCCCRSRCTCIESRCYRTECRSHAQSRRAPIRSGGSREMPRCLPTFRGLETLCGCPRPPGMQLRSSLASPCPSAGPTENAVPARQPSWNEKDCPERTVEADPGSRTGRHGMFRKRSLDRPGICRGRSPQRLPGVWIRCEFAWNCLLRVSAGYFMPGFNPVTYLKAFAGFPTTMELGGSLLVNPPPACCACYCRAEASSKADCVANCTTCSTTRACSATANCGYMGKETISAATLSVTGQSPGE